MKATRITLSESTLAKLDKLADEQGRSRSEVVGRALEQFFTAQKAGRRSETSALGDVVSREELRFMLAGFYERYKGA
jgi:predicted transcriptional regulator